MRINWTRVREELARWRAENLTLPIWWRDDDAQETSAPLERLSRLSETLSLPVHLAVVPRDASSELAEFVLEQDHVIPVVHGWAHRNNAAPGQSRCEFSDARPLCQNIEEAQEAMRRLKRLFGGKLAAMFVPPWNHIDPAILPALVDLGFSHVSTCNPRRLAVPTPGLCQINVHLDPISWRESETLHDIDYLLDRLVTSLRNRREGIEDNEEPFGFLTHHLAMSTEVWEFTEQFWAELLNGPVSVFQMPRNGG